MKAEAVPKGRAMVGDGINDASAMARAHLAVTVHSGQGWGREAAHVTLMCGDPVQLLDFFPLSRRVNRKIAQNLCRAWICNLICSPIAMNGLLTPLVAVTTMLLSNLNVIGTPCCRSERIDDQHRPPIDTIGTSFLHALQP